MTRLRPRYVCQECGYEASRWFGRCPGCGAWNRLVEEPAAPVPRARPVAGGAAVRLDQVPWEEGERFSTGFRELDRILGGGVVRGSLTLLGGEPGIGKSTLLLQVCDRVGADGSPVLYVAGEESARQVRLRAERLGVRAPELYILTETDQEAVEAALRERPHRFAVIDSVQTLRVPELGSAAGSVAQVRECASRLLRLAKEEGVALFLVGHINKEGALAGPKVLEHIVDVVLLLEGEERGPYRLLRGSKNRFGATHGIGLFAMGEAGMEEVPNPSLLFLSQRDPGVTGSVVTASLEGSRPILVEVQALVTDSAFGTPRRAMSGVDANRVALILAVLEKRLGLPFGRSDAYLKVVGGVRLTEPAADLAIAGALLSSFRERPAQEGTVLFGEVGLGGEVRAVGGASARVREAAKLGFSRCLLPAANARQLATGAERPPLELIGVTSVGEAVEAILT